MEGKKRIVSGRRREMRENRSSIIEKIV